MTTPSAVALAVLFVRRHAPTRRRVGEFGRVTVTPTKITPDMRVPELDMTGRYGDFGCGFTAGALFQRAVTTGALAAPDGVRIECLIDNDIETGGFVLVAFPCGDAAWGATTGYHKASVIGTAPEATSEHRAVLAAVEFFARQLNLALDGLDPHPAPTPPPRLLATLVWRLRRRATHLRCECGASILEQAEMAPAREIPGLVSALACVMSLDDRDAGQLVAQARTSG
jgi:hypothetical protein